MRVKAKLVLWWVYRIVLVLAGITWLLTAVNVAFGGKTLSQFEQVFGAAITGVWLMSGGSGWEKPK